VRFNSCPDSTLFDFDHPPEPQRGTYSISNMKFSIQTLTGAVALLAAQTSAAAIRSPSTIAPVVSPSWLLDNLDDPNLILVDIRETRAYTSSHVPGSLGIPFAVSSLWTRTESDNTLIMPPADELVRDLGVHGFTTEKKVVLIPSTAEMPISKVRSTRVAATFLYAGFPMNQLGILDGGFEGWVRAGGSVSTEAVTPTPATYEGIVDGSWIVERDYVHASLNKKEEGVVLLDARAYSTYANGHIESALSLQLTDMFNANGTFKSSSELSALFESATSGFPVTEGEIIVYCQIGLMATGWHYALTNILGYKNVKFYDGSVEDWVKQYPLVKA
jgi:thiosulfate/3-mercaptopyruvate sulfurtransferase